MRYVARIETGEETILELFRDSVKEIPGTEECVIFCLPFRNPLVYVSGRDLKSFCRFLDQTREKYDMPSIRIICYRDY